MLLPGFEPGSQPFSGLISRKGYAVKTSASLTGLDYRSLVLKCCSLFLNVSSILRNKKMGPMEFESTTSG